MSEPLRLTQSVPNIVKISVPNSSKYGYPASEWWQRRRFVKQRQKKGKCFALYNNNSFLGVVRNVWDLLLTCQPRKRGKGGDSPKTAKKKIDESFALYNNSFFEGCEKRLGPTLDLPASKTWQRGRFTKNDHKKKMARVSPFIVTDFLGS